MEDNFYEVPAQVPEKKKSGVFGVLSMILGIVQWLPCMGFLNFLCISSLLSVIFGIIGLCGKRKGKAMAVIGLILGGIMLILEIISACLTMGTSLLY